MDFIRGLISLSLAYVILSALVQMHHDTAITFFVLTSDMPTETTDMNTFLTLIKV
jgi:hypothetical protein